jgi:hypothetical protein
LSDFSPTEHWSESARKPIKPKPLNQKGWAQVQPNPELSLFIVFTTLAAPIAATTALRRANARGDPKRRAKQSAKDNRYIAIYVKN